MKAIKKLLLLFLPLIIIMMMFLMFLGGGVRDGNETPKTISVPLSNIIVPMCPRSPSWKAWKIMWI